MPQGKFSHDEVIIFGHQRVEGSDVSSYLTTFIEFKLGQTALAGYVNKWITALLL